MFGLSEIRYSRYGEGLTYLRITADGQGKESSIISKREYFLFKNKTASYDFLYRQTVEADKTMFRSGIKTRS